MTKWLAILQGVEYWILVICKYVFVSLPRERFQEIKRMMMKHSTHCLFLTCTQNFVYIYTIHNQSLTEPPCEKKKITPTYLEGRCLAYGGESPSILVPCLEATAPPFDSNPLHPFPTPSACITLHYNDDINNLGLLRRGQYLCIIYNKDIYSTLSSAYLWCPAQKN
jgi:hypothetical protein